MLIHLLNVSLHIYAMVNWIYVCKLCILNKIFLWVLKFAINYLKQSVKMNIRSSKKRNFKYYPPLLLIIKCYYNIKSIWVRSDPLGTGGWGMGHTWPLRQGVTCDPSGIKYIWSLNAWGVMCDPFLFSPLWWFLEKWRHIMLVWHILS